MTDFPDKIYAYIYASYRAKSWGTVWKDNADVEYTRSDLCVPRSEYDKLKQHADRLANGLSSMMQAHRNAHDEKGIIASEYSQQALAEYRKETE